MGQVLKDYWNNHQIKQWFGSLSVFPTLLNQFTDFDSFKEDIDEQMQKAFNFTEKVLSFTAPFDSLATVFQQWVWV